MSVTEIQPESNQGQNGPPAPAIPVSLPSAEGAGARQEALQGVSQNAAEASKNVAQLEQGLSGLSEKLDSDKAEEFAKKLQTAGKSLTELEDGLKGLESAEPKSLRGAFGAGALEELKEAPGIGKMLPLLEGGTTAAKAAGGIVANAGIEAIKWTGEKTVDGVKDNLQRDSDTNTAASQLMNYDKAGYPTQSDAVDAANKAGELIERKAGDMRLGSKKLMADYIAAIPSLEGAGITKIDDQVDILGSLLGSAHASGADDATALKDSISVLDGKVSGTGFQQAFSRHKFGDAELGKARESGGVPDLVRTALSDSQDAIAEGADSSGAYVEGIEAKTTSIFGALTKVIDTGMRGPLGLADEMLGKLQHKIEGSGIRDALTVPEDKDVSRAREDEAANRRQSASVIKSLSQGAQHAMTSAIGLEAAAPAVLAKQRSESAIALGLKQAQLNLAEQDELHKAGGDPDQRQAISSRYAKLRNQAAGQAVRDDTNYQIQARQMQIDSYNSVLAKQKQVVDAADAEAVRTKAATKAVNPVSETDAQLDHRRKGLEDSVIALDQQWTASSNPATGDQSLSFEEYQKQRKLLLDQIKDTDHKKQIKSLYSASQGAEQTAYTENNSYKALKNQIDSKVAGQQREIQQINTEAETASLQTKANDEKIDNDAVARDEEMKRQRRNAGFDIEIGDAEANGDTASADKLRGEKKWFGKHDELTDTQRKLQGAANLAPRQNDADFGGHVAATKSVSQSYGQVQNTTEILAAIKNIASTVTDLKNKWASTPVKVEVKFS